MPIRPVSELHMRGAGSEKGCPDSYAPLVYRIFPGMTTPVPENARSSVLLDFYCGLLFLGQPGVAFGFVLRCAFPCLTMHDSVILWVHECDELLAATAR